MKKIRVKITGFWQSDLKMLEMVKDYSLGNTIWKNIEFTVGSYDRLIILTRPYSDDADYDDRKAITFRTEPIASRNNRLHKTSFIAPLSLVGWSSTNISREIFANKGMAIRKTGLLSSVTSDLCYLDGHLARLKFIHALDQIVQDGFDLWGKNINGNFFQMISSYKGPIEDKYDALLKYKYHFNCENSFNENYYTEKLLDPILAESLCFYDGCTNISSFIDDRAYVKLDVNNIEASIETIVRSINSNEWRKRIPYIRKQKERITTHLNPLNIIWMAVNDMDLIKECTL
ncbi:glycosyltransferase family 10 [Pedobacter nutrimenti]|uniref:glycosyltransferase family 10 n=1 Tax=Pedobacter nutrimenti TaxID=1241337 RepID=UPI002930B635|nr:glycosyltransferase family 10 [Pedobacter nutrimenti]